jgi:SNF2 family DNA or RNA helicase
MNKFKPYAHQTKFANLWGKHERVLNFDGCGTGKTLACIHAVKTYWPGARVLVLAPLSILVPAWKRDLLFGWPETTIDVAAGTMAKKTKAFTGDAQWVITNHDTVKTIAKEEWYQSFDVLIVDEGDAFRNRTSQRSKAMQTVAKGIPVVTLMTGTPSPNSVLDTWHLAHLVDAGERLGQNFYGFRQQVCDPQVVFGAPPGATKWIDKEGANDHVTLMLSDISSRVTLDDVQELPETIFREVGVTMPPKLRQQYDFLKRESVLMLENGELVNAIHAGARTQKLLQTITGSVYDEHGVAKDIHTGRHSLVLDLVEETDHCLVAFNWTHQRDGLVAEARKRKVKFAVIDGGVPAAKRAQIVAQFQAGELHVIFAHPQSAGHGLTLTRANRVIWSSPTYRADLYEQFNHRIIRTGQSRKTEIIHIAAEDSLEIDVYERLMDKKAKMDDLLGTLAKLAHVA